MLKDEEKKMFNLFFKKNNSSQLVNLQQLKSWKLDYPIKNKLKKKLQSQVFN